MLPPNWYQLIVPKGVTLNLPGIYQWSIEGIGTYIGKYTRSSRPLKEYEKNVLKILTGKPYRPQKPTSFRRIHRELERAIREHRTITLTILENATPATLNQREQHYITLHASNLNGRENKTTS